MTAIVGICIGARTFPIASLTIFQARFDFGRGIDGLLVKRQIVTPIDPHTTFHDDPLRVLQAIRFSVRYDMDLSDDNPVGGEKSRGQVRFDFQMQF